MKILQRSNLSVLLLFCACAGAPPAEHTAVPARASMPDPAEASALLKDALAAHERKDWPAFLAASEKALAIVPNSPRAADYVACAHALSGHRAEAVAALERIVRMRAYLDVGKDPDLASLRGDPGFEAVRAKLDALMTERTHASRVAFRLPEKDTIPEGIVFDASTGAFFVSSVHKRKIVRVTPDGASKDFTNPVDELDAVLGMALDRARSSIWACTAAVPEMTGYTPQDKGRTALMRIDLETGRKAARAPLGAQGEEHACNDVAVDQAGTVFVSDAASGDLLVLGKEALEPIVHGRLRSPQGIVPRAKDLIVADYSRGLAKVDRATHEVTWLRGPDDVVLAGIDGLVGHGNKVFGIQNGIEPARVLELTIEGDAVGARVLEMNQESFHEPTLGVIVNGELFYVANSQWGSFDDKGVIWPQDRLAEPLILRLRLW
jgi:hypothetical protein